MFWFGLLTILFSRPKSQKSEPFSGAKDIILSATETNSGGVEIEVLVWYVGM
jgi:hypothetical protein